MPIEQKYFRRLRAPSENRSVVVHPGWDRIPDLVRENILLRSQTDFDFQGRKLTDIRRQAKQELLDAAKLWTANYRSIDAKFNLSPDKLFLAGHQPQMFHPGVWFKNFSLSRLAEKEHATAVNLIIDSDSISSTSLPVPTGSIENPILKNIPFDSPSPAIPYEERRVEDHSLFQSFGHRVQEQIAPFIPNPLIEYLWPIVIDQLNNTDRIGYCIAQARHILEGQWGFNTLEIPQSVVCDQNSFHWFTAYLLAQLPKFSAVYNDAVREYRRLYHIRSASHPAPDLAVDSQWFEAPFWIWTTENPRRKRLYVKHGTGELLLTDRQDITERLPFTNPNNLASVAEKLTELALRGIKIRSRALITTLWARLVLSDLFIHGIGGGNYDLVTDRIIERFFHQQPPGFMILSATLLLPINLNSTRRALTEDRSEAAQSENSTITNNPKRIDRELRDLEYHPEVFLNGMFNNSNNMPAEIRPLIEKKQKWIHTPQTLENAKIRCHSIREVNEKLQAYLSLKRSQLLDLRQKLAQQLNAQTTLNWREYGFCLYPDNSIQALGTRLPSNNY